MTTKLITDGSLDLPPNIIEQYEIRIVQPIVIIDGEELINEVDISPQEFFERQRTARILPKTSQPAPQQFAEAFEEALKTHDRVLYIGLTSALSGTFNSAQQAAAQFPADKIVLHDSRTISGAGGFQVIAAARVLAKGGTLEEALAAAQRTHQETELIFSVDDLTYLIKGGRVGRVAGAIGTLLNIRPIIQVDKEQGVFVPATRVRSFKAAMRKILSQAVHMVGEGQPARFMLLYGETMEPEAQKFTKKLHKHFDVRWLHSAVPSPVLCVYTGPRALGLVLAPGDWP
ncbi:MAG: DegV family protein [Ardenticatenaceae bacterium]